MALIRSFCARFLKQMHKQHVLSTHSVLFSPEACLFNSPPLFSLSPGLHTLHAQDETPGEVKRGAGMEFCSIYHPEIFLLERHTLFSLSPHFLRGFLLPLTSHLCDMWSFHFIPGWLSSALKICCCPPIPSRSIAGCIELHRPIQIFFPSSYNSFPNLPSVSAVGRTFYLLIHNFILPLCGPCCHTYSHEYTKLFFFPGLRD